MPSDYLYDLGDVYSELIEERETNLVSVIREHTQLIKEKLVEKELCDSKSADKFVDEILEFARNYKEF